MAAVAGKVAGKVLDRSKAKPAPTVDEWRAAKEKAYDAAETGIGKVRMTRQHVQKLQRSINDAATKEGIGGPLSSTVKELYGKSTKIIDDLNRLGQQTTEASRRRRPSASLRKCARCCARLPMNP